MAAYARAGGNNKKGVKLEAMEGSQAVRKRTNSRRRTLIQTAGGQTGTWANPIIRYPRELVKFPVLLVVAANCL
jgi:hypothetical protein